MATKKHKDMDENVKKQSKMSAKIAGDLLGLSDMMAFVVVMRFGKEEGKTFNEWKKLFIVENIIAKETKEEISQ